MPKDRFPKLTGGICNVPIDLANIKNVPLRSADNNGLLLKKLKRKLSYRGHVYFEVARPNTLSTSLLYLKQNNNLLHDIATLLGNIQKN